MRYIAILSGIVALLFSVCAFGGDDPIFDYQPFPGGEISNENAVREAMGLEAGLVCYWDFDEDFTATYGGPTFDGSPINGVSIDSTGGRFGGAAYFERDSSQYITVDAPVIEQGQDNTYSAWYKLNVPDITGGDRYFVLESIGPGGSDAISVSYGLRDDNGVDVGEVFTQKYDETAYNTRFPEACGTVWHNIIVMYDASEAEHIIYLDGECVDTLASTYTLIEVASLVIGGHRDGTGRNWEGWIDEVAFWDRTLTADEIASIQTSPVLLFNTAVEYDAEYRPVSILATDIDDDDDKDLAMVNTSYFLLLKNEDGDFSTKVSYYAGSGPNSLCAADFDNDGSVDFAMTNAWSNDISILQNGGDGTYDSVITIGTGGADSLPTGIVAGDFDNDGDEDLAYANRRSQNICVWTNTGNGTFTSMLSYHVGYDPCDLATADFNGDGYLDLAVGRNNSSWRVLIMLNQGDSVPGVFTLTDQAILHVSPSTICVSDLDGDGDIDMAMPLRGSSPDSVIIVYNDGAGVFGTRISYPAGDSPYSVCADDFDGDGDKDLAVSNLSSNDAMVYLNNGDLTFSEVATYAVSDQPRYMCAADLDGDYDIDLAVANFYGPSVSVLTNQTGPYTRACCLPLGDCEMLTIENCMDLGGTPMEAGTECSPDEACYMPEGYCEMLSPECCLNLGGEPQGVGSQCPLFETPYSSYPVGDYPASVCAADIDNDGDNDLVMANQYADAVGVMRNDGERIYTAMDDIAVGDLPRSVATADFDLDGDIDLATANYNSDDVSILINTDSGTYESAVSYQVGGHAGSIVAVNLDDDEYPDLAVGLVNTGRSVYILLNNGESEPGTFTPVGEFGYPLVPFAIAAADFDGDGFNDLATGTWPGGEEGDSLVIMFNDGGGNFDTKQSYHVGETPAGFAAADFDHDDDIDLAVGTIGSNEVAIFFNDGSGIFALAQTHYVGSRCQNVCAADYNNDGNIDVAVTGEYDSVVVVFLNNGSGTFTEFDRYIVAESPSSMFATDLDGDNFIDLVTVNGSSDKLYILYNWKNVGKGCRVEPTRIDFPEVALGDSLVENFTIFNTGTIPMTGSVEATCEDFYVTDEFGSDSPISYTLDEGESKVFTVVFKPQGPGPKYCSIETGNQYCSDYVQCEGWGPTDDLEVGGLTISAGTIDPDPHPDSTNVYILSGGVNANGLVFFPDSTRVNTGLSSISADSSVDGSIFIKTTVDWFDWVPVYYGAFTIIASDSSLGFAGLSSPVEFDLWGLDVAVETFVFQNGGIVVQGELVLPPEIPGDGGARIDSLEITKDNVVCNAEITLPDFDIGTAAFSEGWIKFYTDSCGGIFGQNEENEDICGTLYGGGIFVKLEDKLGLGGWLEFTNGSLNRVKVEFELDTAIAIGATGLGFKGASGDVQNFAPGIDAPLTVSVDAKLVGGPELGDDYLIVFETANLTFTEPFSLEATIETSILGSIPLGYAHVLYENYSLSLDGGYNLFDMYDMSYGAHISTSGFSGNVRGTLWTPGNLPWWLDFAENRKIGSFAADMNTNYIRGKASIKLGRVCVNYLVGKKCWTIYSSFAAKIVFKKNSPYFDFYIGTNYSNFTEVIKRRYGKSLEYTYLIPEHTSEVLCYVRQETQPLPEFYLIDPDSNILNIDSLPYIDSTSSGDSVYFGMYYLEDPMVGPWTAVVVDASAPGCTVIVKSPNLLPSICITEPSEPGDAPTIAWAAQDFDDNADITFYFDDDKDGFDGLPINTVPIKEDARSGSFTWDADSITPGEYYIYGIIDDTLNAPIRLYAPGTIIVEPPVQIPAPTGLQGVVVDSAIQLTWSAVPGFTQYVAFYRNVTKFDSKPTIGAATDSTECSIEGLVGGRTYEFMVAAVSDSGQVGETSDSVVLPYVSPDYNSPTISSDEPPRRAYVGSAYQHCFTVEDLDAGDVFDLTFHRSPDGMLLSETCINWTPAPGQDGFAFVDLKAIDRDGNADTLAFGIEVLDTSITVPRVYFNSNIYRGEDDEGYIALEYFDEAHSDTLIDTATVVLTSTSDQVGIDVECIETSPSSNEFTAVFAFSTAARQENPPQILVASGDRVMVEVPQGTEDDMAIFDNAEWYELTRGCGAFDMTIQPAKWSLEWLEAGHDEQVIVPPMKVILSVQDTSLSVDQIKRKNLRLNGIITPLRGSNLVIDSSKANPCLIIEFDAMLAMYSMGDVSGGSDYPVSLSGLFVDNTPFCAEGTVTVEGFTSSESDDEEKSLPQTYSLSQNKPNPFNMNTVIDFAIPIAGHVEVVIYNILGERVRTLTSKRYEPGTYTVEWDGSDKGGYGVASGVYFYQLNAGDFVKSKKMLLLK